MYNRIKWFRTVMDANANILSTHNYFDPKVTTSMYVREIVDDENIVICLSVVLEDGVSRSELCSSFIEIRMEEFKYLVLYIAYGYVNSYIVKFFPILSKSDSLHISSCADLYDKLSKSSDAIGYGVRIVQI